MTDATRPANESGPYVPRILSSTVREPLPDTGLKRQRGITPRGIPKNAARGEKSLVSIFIAPEAESIVTARVRPVMGGMSEKNVSAPPFAPSRKQSKTFIRRAAPDRIISVTAEGNIQLLIFSIDLLQYF